MPAPSKQRKSQGDAVRTDRDGNAIPEEVYLTAPGDSALACCAQDILERERAEDALRESEKRYRLLFESIPQPTWVFDAETLSFLTVNDVVKFALLKVSSNSPRTACQSSWVFINATRGYSVRKNLLTLEYSLREQHLFEKPARCSYDVHQLWISFGQIARAVLDRGDSKSGHGVTPR